MTAEPSRWATRLYDAYVFDMDGTIYLGDHLLPGARRLIEELRERNIPVRFLTNNPTKDLHQYAYKLTSLGLPSRTSLEQSPPRRAGSLSTSPARSCSRLRKSRSSQPSNVREFR